MARNSLDSTAVASSREQLPVSDNSTRSTPSPISPPAITQPGGGGAIRGIGEKFAANSVTGTGTLSVPIAVSPGRSGFGPQLSLAYDSGAGNGPFGLGWSLTLPAISRKTDKGLPKYDDAEQSDVFILSGSEDLVPILNDLNERFTTTAPDGDYTIHRYRPRIESLFARIERWTHNLSGEAHWRSITGDNVTTWYGKTTQSRIYDPADPTHVFSWVFCASCDPRGNAMVYEYVPEDPRRIDLTRASESNRNDASRGANRYLVPRQN